MKRLSWRHHGDPTIQTMDFVDASTEPGIVLAEFEAGGDGVGLSWAVLEPWTRTRAVTVAVVDGPLASPALDVALCSDLVYVLATARLRLAGGSDVPSPGVIWALGRAGRRALARGLLSTADVGAGEALDVGIAHAMIRDRAELPEFERLSLTAATAARDLLRSVPAGVSGLAVELATFRLLFASGDPGEGARAFLEKREPSF